MTAAPDPASGTDRLGTLEDTGEGWVVHYRRRLAAPPAVVWQAFADPDLVARWFPSSIEGELTDGAPLRFVIDHHGVEPFDGSVIEADPPHRLVFWWGPDRLAFELAASGDGTELSLAVLVSELGKAARDGAGWHECLDQLVEVHAPDGEALEVATWAVVHPRYVERFGPEASTIGPPPGFGPDGA